MILWFIYIMISGFVSEWQWGKHPQFCNTEYYDVSRPGDGMGFQFEATLNRLIGYALCRRSLEVHVCVKLGAPTDAGVQSFFVACLFVLYHGNKPSKMYLTKGSLEVKLPTRGTYGKAEVERVTEEQRRSKKIREEKGSEERRCRCAKG